MNSIRDIYPEDFRPTIYKLIKLFGELEIERCLKKYRSSIERSGPIMNQYYHKRRHPWWEPLDYFYRLENSGKSIASNRTESINELIRDAKMLTELQKTMPHDIKTEYLSALKDNNLASSRLFELSIAWHFLIKGCNIKWDIKRNNRNCEFAVHCNSLSFNVECKWMSLDTCKQINRKEVYRLADLILPDIHGQRLCGRISVTIPGKLSPHDITINSLKAAITSNININSLKNTITFNEIIIDYNLRLADDKSVDIDEVKKHLAMDKGASAHAVVSADISNGKHLNPIEFTIQSKMSNTVLDGIYKKITKDAKNQLEDSMPGIICFHIEGVNDFEPLADESALKNMTNTLFAKESMQHIAAIIYSSDGKLEKHSDHTTYYAQTLSFKNDMCKFPEAITFQYPSHPSDPTR